MTSPNLITKAPSPTARFGVAPQGFSLPEWWVYSVLIALGKKPEVDFSFQGRFFGGRQEKGGIIVDFLFYNPPDLAINVQGTYYHYEQGSAVLQNNLTAQAMLAQQGVTLVFIDDEDLARDPFFYVREGLVYRDHSRQGLR